MRLWGTIASAVIGSGAKALFGAGKTSKRNMPSFRVTKVRGMKGRVEGTDAIATQDVSADVGSISRLARRHEALMESFDTKEGAVTGKYGTMRV